MSITKTHRKFKPMLAGKGSSRSIVTFMIMLELKLYRITLAHTSCTI